MIGNFDLGRQIEITMTTKIVAQVILFHHSPMATEASVAGSQAIGQGKYPFDGSFFHCRQRPCHGNVFSSSGPLSFSISRTFNASNRQRMHRPIYMREFSTSDSKYGTLCGKDNINIVNHKSVIEGRQLRRNPQTTTSMHRILFPSMTTGERNNRNHRLFRQFISCIISSMYASCGAMPIVKKISQLANTCNRWLLPALLSLAFFCNSPSNSHAATSDGNGGQPISSLERMVLTSSSSNYLLQNNQKRPIAQKKIISIQTPSSQPYLGRHIGRSKYNSRSSINQSRKYYKTNKKQRVRLLSLLIVAATFAASSFRASRSIISSDKGVRPVRTVTPFGMIRNVSPLGNGVSVIRARMALEFDDEKMADAGSLLEKLQQADNEIKKMLVTLSQQQMQRGEKNALRQRLLADDLSKGE